MKTKILVGVILVFLLAQFVRPARNESSAPTPADLAAHFPPPPDVQRTLEQACYDCHSNNTRYPWYAEVQPVAWWLSHHIKEGKRHLNFNEFLTYSAKRQPRKMKGIIEEVEHHDMPLASYRWIHRDARLDDAQIAALRAWAERVEQQLPAHP